MDYPDTPIALIATILANTLVPFVSDQGEAISLCTVIVHYIAETIELNCPLQSAVFSVYVIKSLYLILILYPVIGEPLELGADQEIVIELVT